MFYTIKNTVTYRAPTVADALRLREYLENNMPGELTSFKYNLKQLKAKGGVYEEYQLITATFNIDNEKEPEGVLPVYINETNEERSF